MVRIAVIGAGIVGLSTAVSLQRALPHQQVTIIADKFNDQTTSDGAAGLFRPSFEQVPGTDPALVRRWVGDSWNHYASLVKSPESDEAGVSVLSGFHFYSGDDVYKQRPVYSDFVYSFQPCTDQEYNIIAGPRKKHGVAFTTVLVECRRYLPWLLQRFRENGGQVVKRKIKHLIEVHAPWIKHVIYVENDTYIIPGRDSVTVGGVKQLDNDSLEISSSDSADIWKRACHLLPTLKTARWLKEWVGLRPHRVPLRLDTEQISGPQGYIKVVHNYGHGGHGISLSWGTAQHATELVRDLLKDRTLSAKL